MKICIPSLLTPDLNVRVVSWLQQHPNLGETMRRLAAAAARLGDDTTSSTAIGRVLVVVAVLLSTALNPVTVTSSPSKPAPLAIALLVAPAPAVAASAAVVLAIPAGALSEDVVAGVQGDLLIGRASLIVILIGLRVLVGEDLGGVGLVDSTVSTKGVALADTELESVGVLGDETTVGVHDSEVTALLDDASGSSQVVGSGRDAGRGESRKGKGKDDLDGNHFDNV